MTTFHLNTLPKEKRIQMIGEFYDMVDSLKDRNEIRLFFKSLLTADEIATLMRRIEISVLLSVGYKYDKIIEMLGVGRDKISFVSKNLLQDDSGYKFIAERLIENRKQRLRKIRKGNKRSLSPFESLKSRPGHRLLANLIDTAIEKLEEDDKLLEEEALLFTPSLKYSKKLEK
ncbi:MAG: Trp family transcriptional regulator [Candidatus Staskawiczbacteria bacterium]|nr:Trp family transcriptional regulator [Candidatus Staskawiczbacteria bacterium]